MATRKKPKDTDELAFLAAQIAQRKARAKGFRSGDHSHPLTDDTARLVFADWLAERGDPREVIVRNHVRFGGIASDPGGSFLAQHVHPEQTRGESEARIGINHGDRPGGPTDRSTPPEYDFGDDLIHPGVSEEQYPTADGARYNQRPAIVWRHHSREKYGSYSGAGSFHPPVFFAPVTWDQYHAYADTLPEEKRKQWHAYARLHYTEGRAGRKPPAKLARAENTQLGPGAAIRALGSDNHAKRVELVKSVLSEAGLTPATARAVMGLSDERGVRPAVAALIGRAVNPSVARFAAAWIGLLTQERMMTVFHPGDGEDTMHVIDSPHPAAHVGEYLRRAGVPAFTMETRGRGTRVYVVAPMDLNDVKTAASGLGGTHAAVRGTAVRLGSGSESDAEGRAAFRQVIDDSEKEAGL